MNPPLGLDNADSGRARRIIVESIRRKKIAPMAMEQVDHLMHEALTQGVFPGAVLMVAFRSTAVFQAAYGQANLFTGEKMTQRTIFDLASLTKPLATTLAVMNLVQSRHLALDQTLGSLLPSFEKSDKGRIRIEALLRHTAGYPAYRPYYRTLMRLAPVERKGRLLELLRNEPLEIREDRRAVYSDLGFMVLGAVIEEVTGQCLDRFVREAIYRPLGLESLRFMNAAEGPPQGRFAATELCPLRHALLIGVVHDENAYAMGGIQGHAGLFGHANDILSLLLALSDAHAGRSDSPLFATDQVRCFLGKPAGVDRALGFDVPSEIGSSAGRFFSPNSVGHLGFTGTSFWMDLTQEVIVILLTNRVHPHRYSTGIRRFRPRLHDAIMLGLGLKVKDSMPPGAALGL
jgi:serine-type D-Ala-D-Ala carboxypeptidase